jgi:hypothetical protein
MESSNVRSRPGDWQERGKGLATTVRFKEFRHPSNYRSEQFARTSAFEAALRSGTELIGTIVACA